MALTPRRHLNDPRLAVAVAVHSREVKGSVLIKAGDAKDQCHSDGEKAWEILMYKKDKNPCIRSYVGKTLVGYIHQRLTRLSLTTSHKLGKIAKRAENDED